MPLMNAMQLHRLGTEDVLRNEDVAIPCPAPREILIEVQAAGISGQ